MRNKKKRTIEEIKPLLEKVKNLILARYRKNVEAIILYGSFVRGIADEDSDNRYCGNSKKGCE